MQISIAPLVASESEALISAFQFAIRIDSVSQKIGPFNSTTTWSLYAIFNNLSVFSMPDNTLSISFIRHYTLL